MLSGGADLRTVQREARAIARDVILAGPQIAAFADPPFNIGYKYDVYEDRQSYDDFLTWSEQWMGAVHRVLKPTGTFWLAIGDEYAAELKVMLQREHKLTCRSWVVWYYTFGVNCKHKFSRRWRSAN